MLKTKASKARAEKHSKIHKAYTQLLEKGAMKTAAQEKIVEKFGVSRSTVQAIERRFNEESPASHIGCRV